LEEFIEAISFRAQEKGLELILDTTHLSRTSVITDPGRLRQILTNLIGNAVKFTHTGEILVKVLLDEVDANMGRLRIDVRDSGIGIAEDKIDKLFETFAQADNSTTRKYGGTGLGLAIVKKLCELMDGSVWITSVEHEGSTFHIDIGVGLGEVPQLSVPCVWVQGANPLETKDYLGTLQDDMAQIQWPADTRILLVEDNLTNQVVAQGMLEMIGLSADIANNGLEALEAMQLALDVAPYTLILMDCQMPEMDGYAASTAIREGKAGKEYLEIPIVAMTANAMAGDREKCLISGMNDYVSKPINLTTLKTTLIKWLGGNIIANESSITIDRSKAHRYDEKMTELKVWDEADALKRLGGKKELLLKVMQSFVNESTKMMNGLETAIAQNDLSHVQLYAHSIKGSAGNVSAQQLQALF
jgi:CheY-like chemotaxis protein